MEFGERDRRQVSNIRADRVEAGDILMETLRASGTLERVILREEGRVLSVQKMYNDKVTIDWVTPYGEERRLVGVEPHVIVTVVR